MPLSASVKPDVPKMELDFAYEYCNVSRKVKGSPNALGEAAWTWTAIDSNVKVDLQPVAAEELKRTAAGIERIATHRAFFLSDVGFIDYWDAEDEEVILRIETDSSGNGTADTYFLITAVDPWDSHVEVLCKKVPADSVTP